MGETRNKTVGTDYFEVVPWTGPPLRPTPQWRLDMERRRVLRIWRARQEQKRREAEREAPAPEAAGE